MMAFAWSNQHTIKALQQFYILQNLAKNFKVKFRI